MARPIDIKVTLDLPDGVEFLGTERVGDGHGTGAALVGQTVARA